MRPRCAPSPPLRLLVAALLLAQWMPSHGRTTLAPIVWGGELYYRSQQHDSRRSGSRDSSQQGIRLDVRSFIMQPWIATWDARLDFATNTSNNDGDVSDADTIGGALNLRLFPRSHFPGEVFFRQSDSRLDNDAGFVSDTRVRRFGVSQRYRNRAGANFFATVERLEARDDRGADAGTAVRLGASHTIGIHSLVFDFDHTSIDRDAQPGEENVARPDTESTSASLGHRARLPGNLSISNNVDFADQTDFLDPLGRQGFTALQYDGFATWVAPGNSRLRVTGTIRASDIERETASVDTLTRRFSVVTGMNYDLSERVAVSASAGVHRQGGRDAPTRRSQVADAGINYRSDRRELGAFEYDWNAAARASLSMDEAETRYRADLGAGHGATLNLWQDQRSSLLLRLNQRLNFSESWSDDVTGAGDDPSEVRLDHSIGMNWSGRYRQSNFFAGLSLSDSRRVDQGGEAFTMAALQFNGNRSFSRDAHLNGSVSYRLTYNERDSGETVEGGSLSMSLRQTVDRLFGVRNLRFRSDLRLQQTDNDAETELEEQILADRRAERLWSNELDYLIGRLRLSLEYRIAEHDDDTTHTVSGRLSRRFGN